MKWIWKEMDSEMNFHPLLSKPEWPILGWNSIETIAQRLDNLFPGEKSELQPHPRTPSENPIRQPHPTTPSETNCPLPFPLFPLSLTLKVVDCPVSGDCFGPIPFQDGTSNEDEVENFEQFSQVMGCKYMYVDTDRRVWHWSSSKRGNWSSHQSSWIVNQYNQTTVTKILCPMQSE